MPLSRRARIRIALLSLVAVVAVYVGVCTSLERTRIRGQSHRSADAAHATQHVDRATLLQDVRALSDPAMQGRGTGSPGGRRARAYVERQMAAIGLVPLETSLVEPFRFVRTSIKGLFLPGRPFRTSYDDAANVIGRIPGAASRQMVVSAHYDHLGIRGGVIYPGADDNASGVALT